MYRWIDKYIGGLLCLFFACINLFKKQREAVSFRKILILKFYEMGCIALLQPCLKALRRKYPDSKIYLFTVAKNKEIVEMTGVPDGIFTADDRNIFKFVIDVIRNIKKIRKENIDVLVDLEFLTRFTAILTFLISAKKSMGFYSKKVFRGNFHTDKIEYPEKKHILEIYKDVFRELGADVEYRIPFELEYDIPEFLKNYSGKIVSININSDAAILERRWPYKYFLELVKFLQSTEYKTVLTGSKEDKKYVDSFVSKLGNKNIENLAGKLTLRQLAGLFKISRLVVSSDSGPLHIAYAVGTPTVSFFGPESPDIFGPIGDKHINFYKNLDCSPCVDVYNGKIVRCVRNTIECLENIKPEEVIRRLRGILADYAEKR
ncbi:MAG: glycosyltransferase family 9 protein [Elusimicrobia bacterium]|nr:glycosyltransferase family 9 protein [Elusimicrobiota bacterium]